MSFADCVTWARFHFEENYCNQIKQLLYNFPRDQQTTSGQPFWSGPKRCPDPIIFNADEDLHVDYVFAAANLKAEIYGIPQVRDRNQVCEMARSVKVSFFQFICTGFFVTRLIHLGAHFHTKNWY
jgi:ubiquitin-activating enzyme E1